MPRQTVNGMDDRETSSARIPTEFLEEWFVSLAATNAANVNLASTHRSYLIKFRGQKFSELIFNMCERLLQPTEVKYLALEIFSRFMLKHIAELHDHVMRVYLDEKKRLKEWNIINTRVSKQVFLRAVTSVQIASKVTSHYKVLSAINLNSLLQEAGYNYSSSSILNSELRILKALNYQVNIPTAITYLNFFLQVLFHNEPAVNIDLLRQVSIKTLEVVILQQQEAYLLLFVSISNTSFTKNRAEFATVENDLVYLAVVVISCAAYFINDEVAHKITEHLHIITEIPEEDITNFVRVLIPFFN